MFVWALPVAGSKNVIHSAGAFGCMCAIDLASENPLKRSNSSAPINMIATQMMSLEVRHFQLASSR